MEDGRQVITLEDITQHIFKTEKWGFIAWPALMGFICLFIASFKLVFDWIIWDVLIIGFALWGLCALIMTIVNIRKIKSGTYFSVTTDVLRQKDDEVFCSTQFVMRLYFQCDHYDIIRDNCYVFDPHYQMPYSAIYDTAFIGDSFTLVKVKKNVVLAYNNKLYDVQVP